MTRQSYTGQTSSLSQCGIACIWQMSWQESHSPTTSSAEQLNIISLTQSRPKHITPFYKKSSNSAHFIVKVQYLLVTAHSKVLQKSPPHTHTHHNTMLHSHSQPTTSEFHNNPIIHKSEPRKKSRVTCSVLPITGEV